MSLTQQMSPHGGPPRRRRSLLLAAVAVVVLIAATVGVTVALTGGGDGSHPAAAPPSAPAPTRFGIPSPQPGRSATADPTAPLLLPHPARAASNGVPLGFPHTPDGAASAAVRWTSLILPTGEDRQLDVFRTIETAAAYTRDAPTLREGYREHPLAADFWSTATPLACGVTSTEDADGVSVSVLATLQVGDATGVTGSSLWANEFHLVWQGDDWRLDDIKDVSKTHPLPSGNSRDEYQASGWREFQLA
ncbi:hypothetical protein [Frankia canadensis]|nr:hypothetical protein [Frankia canadensis]